MGEGEPSHALPGAAQLLLRSYPQTRQDEPSWSLRAEVISQKHQHPLTCDLIRLDLGITKEGQDTHCAS